MATKKKAKSTASKKTAAKKTAVKKTVTSKKTEVEQVVAEKTTVTTKFDKCCCSVKPSALLAEIAGVFVLTSVAFAVFNGQNIVMSTLCAGLAMTALVVIFGAMSGAHFNPATTIALWANRKIGGAKAVLYVLAQSFGALLAFLVFRGIFAANNGIDPFAGSDALIINQLVAQYGANGITEEVIREAGGLATFATNNGFESVQAMAQQLNLATIVENTVSISDGVKGLGLALNELIAAIIFGFGAGFAYLRKTRPFVKGLVLGLSLFAALTVGGATAIVNPAVAGALGSFMSGWFGIEGLETTALVNNIVWPLVAYVVVTVAGVLIGLTAYRFMMKDSEIEENETCDKDLAVCPAMKK